MTIDEIRDRRSEAELRILRAITAELDAFTSVTDVVPESLNVETTLLVLRNESDPAARTPIKLQVKSVALKVRI